MKCFAFCLIRTAVKGALGIQVVDYPYWSIIDAYEWYSGYGMKFGPISLNRGTQEYAPKEILYVLGKYTR